ncbi:hypothetical protein C9413_26670 [Rhizobium sp. SEMIA 4085]|uniref:hypothetical protein n=1 Tax=Rhizobium TaxID=379 RepID=UPI000589FA59|nr:MULTISPECIES: hypothetical protein [Rhizobium]NNH32893.1 hypothetical protein [Rhizobium sp. SEMIA 4085]
MIRRTLSASLLAALFLATRLLPRKQPSDARSEAAACTQDPSTWWSTTSRSTATLLEVTATFAPKTGGDPLRFVMWPG